jgi:16S rRNA (uracil1498-N3)-methyltransferase
MQHFLLPSGIPQGKTLMIQDRELVHQLISVLRFRVGEACVLLDGAGLRVQAKVTELHKKAAVFELGERVQDEAPKDALTLYIALSKKPATLELIVQKATELGVTSIVPLVTDRCQVRELRKVDRLQAIIKEACEQSERSFLPELAPVLSLKDLLKKPPQGLLLAGDPRDYDASLSSLKKKGDLNLIIGPEGGLNAEELEAIREAGGKIFQLGTEILRMETAALAALSVLRYS